MATDNNINKSLAPSREPSPRTAQGFLFYELQKNSRSNNQSSKKQTIRRL